MDGDIFPPLPASPDATGAERRVGIEFEFGGLPGDRAADLIAAELRGRVVRKDGSRWELVGSRIGTVELYLDTAYRPQEAGLWAQAATDLARVVVPLEIVTEPLSQADLPLVDAAIGALEQAGAEGSSARLVYGFGLHLNIGLTDPEHGADMPRTVLAFALLEPWMRARDPLDFSRRVLPFTAPFPPRFADALAAIGPGIELPELLDAIDTHIADRNHGLDLLPAYAHLAPQRFARHKGATAAVSARPAFHLRAPDARLGLSGGTLAYEWRRWVMVERVAADHACLVGLCALREEYQDLPLLPPFQRWLDAVTETLGAHAALAPAGGPATDRAPHPNPPSG